MSRPAVSLLRKRATDRSGVVHEVVDATHNLVETHCGFKCRWLMTWDESDSMSDVTCMACMVKGART